MFLWFPNQCDGILCVSQAPFLGDFEGVDEETGKFMFSLEANNLVDENGNSKQTSAPYFESGWVDENDSGFQWPWDKKKDA